jgi:beta-1,4-N-acetylglucosaminyltransferase
MSSEMPTKACFVTIGATSSFDALIKAVLRPSFLHALKAAGYTNLTLQYGQGGKELFERLIVESQEHGPYGIVVEGFEFTNQMMNEMRIAKPEDGRAEGVVLCHAGMGQTKGLCRVAR